MTCLSEATIVGLLERGLPGEQRAEIEAHLDACASCRRVVVDLTAVLTRSSSAAEDHTTDPAQRPDHGPELQLGAMVGRFVALDRIGRGGMGTVYTAYDPELDRNIALKLLHRQARTGDRARAQILAEAQAMARISHPGVVAIYEVGTFRDRVFAAMELVEGTTLRAWITERPRSWREVVAVFVLAGEGLAAAHAAGVVHRDFKPENVLLGRDGRVKVSDFGLSSLSPAGDGAVAGTPGYLPVEALRGEAVDHRADQFAFCVALYEALHGRRPFSARTADDLAAEVRCGPVLDRRTRGVPKRLDPIVRRGLALAPEDRHASMRELLDALRRTASRRSARRAPAVVAAVVLAAVAVLAVELAREPAPAVDSLACPHSPEVEVASAWSPALRASLVQRLAGGENLGDWLYELDGFAARWIRDYRSACTSPHGAQIVAKRACLLGERDRVAGLLAQLLTLPRSMELPIQPSEEMPRVEACDGESPVAPATLPTDPVRRAKMMALHAKLARSWLSPPEQMPDLLAEMPGLVAEAEALGWDRIFIEAHYAFGLAADRSATRWELARDHYQRAIQLALRSHDYQSEADIWEKRLWIEDRAASEPANPDGVASLIEQARVAVHHAGDGPLRLGRIQHAEAYLRWSAGHLHDDMLASLATARALALSGRDLQWAMGIAANMAHVLADRNRPGDLGAGRQMLVDTLRAATASGLSEVTLLRGWAGDWFKAAFRSNAFLRGDLAVAHTWDDREGPPKPPDGAVALRGRVIDLDGNPVAGATVVAWSGILAGDATRAYLRVPGAQDGVVHHTGTTPPAYHRAGFDADVATTDAGGGFTVRAVPDGGIIAELGDRRSQPRPIGPGAIVLQLEPTRTIEGRVSSDDEVLSGIVLSAHYQLGPTLAWECTTAVGRLHDYRLGGLPAGQATLRLDDWLRDGVRKMDAGPVRDGAGLRWPVGPELDVIVRGGSQVTPWIYVLRGHLTAKTTADLDRLIDGAADATVMPAFVVGAGTRTAEAMKHYQSGDRHRVTLGNAPGRVTVCVAEAEPTAPAMCRTIEIPRTTPEVRDGRGIYPAIPVLFQR